ncbi:MAG: pilus assembly PilX N-terminal domain-containing protein [Burkholderiales bacterium]|jgi:type IV pilus assembly protein PilX
MKFSELSICQARGGETPHDAGFALVIVLLLMVALSMVGIASLRGTTLQEKMAGNLYFRSLALAEAEAALRSTVARVDSKIGLTVETPVAPDSSDLNWKPLIQNGTDLSYWSGSSAWTNTATRNVVSTTATGLVLNATTEMLMSGNQLPTCEDKMGFSACKVTFTRMTSRANDPTTGAAVVLQQHWSFPISK